MRFTFILLLLISGCASQQISHIDEVVLFDKEKELKLAHYMISRGNSVGALNNHLKELVNECQSDFSNSDEVIYVVRSQPETFYLLLLAAAKDTNAKVIDTPCADAFYYMGYASLDLGKIDDAETYVKKALEMSPTNSLYLSELAHIYQVKKDWNLALATFIESEELAQNFSPESVKLSELSRAKRGIGFTLIELGRLDEAREKFQECLLLNPEDKRALNELKYINSIDNKNS